MGLIWSLAQIEDQTIPDVAVRVAAVHPRHTSCTAVLPLNLICHKMSKHTCCSCPSVITRQRNVTVADFSPSISLTSSISFCPHSHLCLSSCKSLSFLSSCSSLPSIVFFFSFYFLTSRLHIWTQTWGCLSKTENRSWKSQCLCSAIISIEHRTETNLLPEDKIIALR